MDKNQSENMSKKETENEMVEKFKEIVRSNGIVEQVSSVIIKDSGLIGEGFSSLTQLVTINFKNPEVKPLNLFVKKQVRNPSHTETLEEMRAFEKEATFLVKYVTAAKQMCAAKGKEGLINFYPKCYFGNNELIVLENIVLDKGYKTLSMDFRQDLEVARVGIQTLAKHHAVGYVMIQESGGPAKFFEKFPDLDYESYDKPKLAAMVAPMFDSSIESCVQILEKCGIPGAISTARKLEGFLGKVWGVVVNTVKITDEDKLLVLGHGDYWNNNMMFLMDNQTNQILHHILVDFQVTRYNTPGIDLAYYLYSSVQTSVRRKYLKDLLELHKETFNKITEDLGYPANLTFEQVFQDYRRKLGLGFWMGLSMAIGPVMAITKEINLNEMDPSLWGEVLADRIEKWSDEYPEKSREVGEELMEWMEEYEQLFIPIA